MRITLVGKLIILAFLLAGTTAAQSVIFNAPSTDTLEEGKVYVEADFFARFKKYDNGGYQGYGFRTVYGLNKKTEIGANFFVTRDGSGNLPREVQFNVKRKLYDNEKRGIAVSAGGLVNVPLTKSAGSRPTAIVYVNASKTVPKLGTRVTGGVYQAIARRRDFGKTWGFTAGFEQPVGRRFAVIGDWFSGANRYGFAFLGLNIAVTKRQFLSFGYNFANQGAGENYFAITYGVTF